MLCSRSYITVILIQPLKVKRDIIFYATKPFDITGDVELMGDGELVAFATNPTIDKQLRIERGCIANGRRLI